MKVTGSCGTSDTIHHNDSHLLLLGKRKLKRSKISCE